MLSTKFAIPDIIFGHGSITHLPQCARRLGAKRVLFVSDSGLEEAGWVELVKGILKANNMDCVYFSDVNSNPRDCQVHEGAELYEKENCDVIVALGGGSPMDAAKGIGVIVGNGGKISDYEGANKIKRPLPPMILVPSTAGSSSDISQYCIITDMEREVKMSIISRTLVPNISIIDPQILVTQSRSLILAAAADALAHAIESYVSKLASPFTEIQALKAIELIINNIGPAADTKSIQAMEQLSIASTAAGMSFSNAGLGSLHAIAHSLGGICDVLHGWVHPVLLTSVMRYNMPSCMGKMAQVGQIIAGSRICPDTRSAELGINHLEDLFKSFDLNTELRHLVPDKTMLESICKTATNDACNLTNPRLAEWQDLMTICEEAW
ncbi:iron-containing alcohol dehydrogenase [Pseudodesulfovibrio sp. zrk46]|uniref:iron-containing alcohol dehydrogenase n=1 Tax=Pseudodesulfovibrio sp. zrk46 TaxID=2725288 RepID=UPI0014493407|nr:iron-containing alcohol dehydrogenase [Pseudodesulfovibrio sp. zrk46]QJB57440.1 iron-containing alcohol dehydrogenase [Pseudodesulfovibrio sp. zrk46]